MLGVQMLLLKEITKRDRGLTEELKKKRIHEVEEGGWASRFEDDLSLGGPCKSYRGLLHLA